MALTERQREVLQDAGSSSLSVVQWMLSVLVAALPPSWRRGLEEGMGLLPETVAVASSVLQVVVFLVIWGLGLAAYMTATPMSDVDSFDDMIVVFYNPALPLVYLLTTVRGALTALGTVGGVVRLFSAVGQQGNLADPTLSLAEFLRCKLLDKRAARTRERSKGERSPDVIEHAQGDEAWDLRIVSYDDQGWHAGVGVRALGVAWKVLAVHEVKDEHGRLRLSHELRRIAGAEAVRGFRSYAPERPPLVVGEAREREQPKATDEPASIPLAPPDPKRIR